MKMIAILLVVGILFSYIPIVPMDDCPEGDHRGITKVNDGFAYHCPLCSLIVSTTMLEPLSLPLVGQLPSTASLPVVDDLARPIFHPPE